MINCVDESSFWGRCGDFRGPFSHRRNMRTHDTVVGEVAKLKLISNLW